MDTKLAAVDDIGARSYSKLADGATLGTVAEYEKDGSWVVVTGLSETPACEYERLDYETDEPLVEFLIMDKLTDEEFSLFENCGGCTAHLEIAQSFADHEAAGYYIPRSEYSEKFRTLGPIHPDERSGGHDES